MNPPFKWNGPASLRRVDLDMFYLPSRMRVRRVSRVRGTVEAAQWILEAEPVAEVLRKPLGIARWQTRRPFRAGGQPGTLREFMTADRDGKLIGVL